MARTLRSWDQRLAQTDAGARAHLLEEPHRLLKLGTLVDWARRSNPEQFRVQIEPINPFVGNKFKHNRISPMLKTDMAPFGEICQRLHREAKKLDRRAHYALAPMILYALGVGAGLVLAFLVGCGLEAAMFGVVTSRL